ncbi:MAG TPA: outer membrane protein assembly factor BamA, partial [Gammaproteobacteria bacterium]|nr:outer membrane protein assembly factor BamA [Gammaproteobacteria bacterium]
MKKIIVVAVLFLNLILSIAFAADAFVVKKIEIEGLQRIAPATVYSYLPIKQGELLRPDKTGEIIKALYKTGFFEHITLAREGNILVITVVERPTIGELKISGNSIVATDKLTTVMKSVGVAEGRVYDQELLEKIKQSLLNQYYQLGRYNARVDVTVARMSRNRVQVKIDISEGLIAKVRRINIIGNHVFSESKLERQLLITTPGLLTIFTQTDRYSQEKLDASLDSLRNYYLDYGYLKFTVKSSQVEITPDRKSIFLTIVIDEGMPYTVKDIVLRGDLILPRDQIRKFIPIEPGDTFSRQSVINANKSISNALGEKGYAFSTVSLEPALDDAHKEVTLVFDVKPGKRAYVRHIYFTNNVKTNDLTLRRKMEQMESSVVSTSKLEQSKHALSLLPYLKDVQMSMQPVGDSDDQVDINYKLTEDNSAQATASIGYSQSEGILLGVGLTQKNFLGTGETLGLNATRSAVQQYYGMSFTDPYYTADGISRTINVSSSRFFPGNSKQERIAQGFTTNQYSASVVYGIPLGQEQNVFNTLQLGYGYESTLVHPRATISNQLIDFNNRNGRHFQQIDLIGGFSRDSRDKAIFPTKGMLHTLGGTLFAPVNNTALKYYMLSYDLKWYHPLTNSLIATTKGAFGYGSSFDGGAQNFPYFKDYYGGGPE